MCHYLFMAVFYRCSCVAPSLVKIAKPGEHPPVVGSFHRGRGLQKRPGFDRGRGRGPGRTMVADQEVGSPHLFFTLCLLVTYLCLLVN